MTRIALQQDLFATAPSPPEPQVDPIAELTIMLAELREADSHPWSPLSDAVQKEFHVQSLARRGGSQGERLAAEILAESERLFASAEQT